MTGNMPKQEMTGPPGKFVSVYVAAKLIHAPMLVDIRKDWPTLYFTARWILTANLASEQAKPASMWTRDNEDDIVRAEVALGYADPNDSLTDVLWELGIAHAHGRPIYLAGPKEAFGKYAFCSSVVKRFEDKNNALKAIAERLNYDNHVDRILAAIEAAKKG